MNEIHLIVICLVSLGLACYSLYRIGYSCGRKSCEVPLPEAIPASNEKGVDENADKTNDKKAAVGKQNVDAILRQLLAQLQCRILNDDGQQIDVRYQAEAYRFSTDGNRPFIWIYDVGWFEFSEDDIDLFAKVKMLINELNAQSGLGVIYHIDEDTGKVRVSSKYTMYMTSDYPDPAVYVEYILGEFARLRQWFFIELK